MCLKGPSHKYFPLNFSSKINCLQSPVLLPLHQRTVQKQAQHFFFFFAFLVEH